MRLFLLWRRFILLLRSIGLAMRRGKPIDWATKIDEATDLADKYLDIQDYPPLAVKQPDAKPLTRAQKRRQRRSEKRK